jgi:hypothetical protein
MDNISKEFSPNTQSPLKPNILMNIKNAKFIPLLLFALFLCLLIFFYLFYRSLQINKQTPSINIDEDISENVNITWNTYRNDKYGYSVDYPSDWNVVEARAGEVSDAVGSVLFEGELQKTTFIESGSNIGRVMFVISIENNPNKYDTESWAKNFNVPLVNDPSTNLAKFTEDVTIDNIKAKKYLIVAYDTTTSITGLVKNDLIYKYNFTDLVPNDPNIEEQNKIFNHFLSSFKFNN